ncbi:hypothetical protein [Pseudomaricurvus sp.]|uniref:hypothetical protein n=1 Tax=Pseudomaricurvus sp. TaxID=2004510 RepID=UPI003F6BE705
MSNGWEQLHSAIQTLSQEVRELAPDAYTADEGEAYVARVLTTCLNDNFLGHLLVENGLSRALPTRGAPNPDYIMQHALLNVRGSYQLTGCLNDSERIGVGLFRQSEKGSLEIADYLTIDNSVTEGDGTFKVDISAEIEGPAGLTLQPEACILLIRTLHRRPNTLPARLQLDGATPPENLSLTGGSTSAALSRVTQVTLGSIRQFVTWSQQAAAFPNQFRGNIEGLEQTMQGDPDTEYFLGYFDLADDEVLQVVLPSDLNGYWSIHAYNHWCEYLPGATVHDLNAEANHKGEIIMHVGPQLNDSVVNPIVTKGRTKGVLLCRILGDSLHHPPVTKIIKR